MLRRHGDESSAREIEDEVRGLAKFVLGLGKEEVACDGAVVRG
jgi:hypothetical protein